MEGNVDAVDASEGTATSETRAQLMELTREASREAQNVGHLNSAMEVAANKIAVAPGTEKAGEDLRSELRQGQVGEVKEEMMSDVIRPGTDPKDTVQGDETAVIEERFQKLYLELTNFQVAWSIARRTQQDVSQLLRGT